MPIPRTVETNAQMARRCVLSGLTAVGFAAVAGTGWHHLQTGPDALGGAGDLLCIVTGMLVGSFTGVVALIAACNLLGRLFDRSGSERDGKEYA